MKNGRSLKGHRRVIIQIGKNSISRRSPLNGHAVSCICGWNGGIFPLQRLAQERYRMHMNSMIDDCLFKCKRCHREKPTSDMRPDYRYMCKVCFSALGNEWQANNPVEAAMHKRKHSYLRRYGITIKEADLIVDAQKGKCAICQRNFRGGKKLMPHIDHDHLSGTVRGVLCFKCNSGIGHFGDDPKLLKRAIEYLERNQ